MSNKIKDFGKWREEIEKSLVCFECGKRLTEGGNRFCFYVEEKASLVCEDCIRKLKLNGERMLLLY